MTVVVRAPAKLNLALVVGSPRPDGFHELACVYHAVDLYDEVAATPGDPGERAVTVDGPGADDIPAGADGASNLAVRAADVLAQECGVSDGVRLRIRKGIPVAGGMAGGSADAAAALVACDTLWETGLSTARLAELAGRLGSDVPFCLFGGTAVGTGRGELVEPVSDTGRYHWVLAFGAEGMSTPAVYEGLDRRRGDVTTSRPVVPDGLLAALRSGSPADVGRAIVNDLQPVALTMRPELGELLRTGERLGALASVVSGSGPTCAFLAVDPTHASVLANALDADARCAGTAVVTGPVAGPLG